MSVIRESLFFRGFFRTHRNVYIQMEITNRNMAAMFEQTFGNGSRLQVWEGDDPNRIRLRASPGGVALSRAEAMELLDELTERINEMDEEV